MEYILIQPAYTHVEDIAETYFKTKQQRAPQQNHRIETVSKQLGWVLQKVSFLHFVLIYAGILPHLLENKDLFFHSV